eukprot:2610504-Rhodomonas_salina.5
MLPGQRGSRTDRSMVETIASAWPQPEQQFGLKVGAHEQRSERTQRSNRLGALKDRNEHWHSSQGPSSHLLGALRATDMCSASAPCMRSTATHPVDKCFSIASSSAVCTSS